MIVSALSTETSLVLAGLVYLGIGLLFGVFFVLRGAQRLDPVAANGTLGFRALTLPGAAVLWPLLLPRVLRGADGGAE